MKQTATHRYYYFNLAGQIPSGKNAIVITRTGLRIPGKVFSKWKKEKLPFLKIQRAREGIKEAIAKPVDVMIKYIAGDRRRRDVPGMVDAIWHLFEKAEIITDDKFLGGTPSKVIWISKEINKEKAGVDILIRELL